MIISPGRGYIFVHIPKTGGTALSLALEGRAMKDDILIGDTPKARRRRGRLKGGASAGRLWKHSTLADIEELVPRSAFDDWKVFTVVRNPWDRLVSYYFWLQTQSFDHPAVALSKSLSFEAFTAHPHLEASFRATPFAAYVTDGAGIEHCDLWLRMERLEADIDRLEAELGLKIKPVPVANASARERDWRVYYSDASAARVADICAEDIARFRYRFDPD